MTTTWPQLRFSKSSQSPKTVAAHSVSFLEIIVYSVSTLQALGPYQPALPKLTFWLLVPAVPAVVVPAETPAQVVVVVVKF
jgi:hypothetical protein